MFCLSLCSAAKSVYKERIGVITLYIVAGLWSYEVSNFKQLFSSEKTGGPRGEDFKKVQYLLNISSGLNDSVQNGFLSIS